MLIGYARVSTVNQNLDRQLVALRTVGCTSIFVDNSPSCEVKGRPELEKALAALSAGDILVLAEWHRATRSMNDGIAVMQRVHTRGAAIKVLDKPRLDLTSKTGQHFLAFLSALAEDERERFVERAAVGRRNAKSKGVRIGRKPKLNERQRRRARRLMSQGCSVRAVADTMNVHYSTIARLR